MFDIFIFLFLLTKLNFQHHYSSLYTHDPSEIIWIYWFAAKETFLIIVNVENIIAAYIFVSS